jgi:hypothetical protein
MLAELLSFLKELEKQSSAYCCSTVTDAFIMQDRHRLGHVLYTPKEICAAPPLVDKMMEILNIFPHRQQRSKL